MTNTTIKHPILDQERQRKALEYAKITRSISFGEMGFSLVLLLILILTPVSRWFISLFEWSTVPTAVVLFLVLSLAYESITFPLSYFREFILPHRYGLSTQSLRSWMADVAKGGSLGLVFGAVAVTMAYLLLLNFTGMWWLLAWLLMIIVSVIMSIIGPVILVPLFYKVKPLEDCELKFRLEDLSKKAGARVHGIFKLDFSSKSTTANAALMGMGRTRRIVLSDTLIQEYTISEIEVVTAHEIGHHLHRDIFRAFVIQSAIYLVGLKVIDVILNLLIAPLGYSNIADPSALPLLLLMFSALSTIISPLNNAYSRHVESQADRYALELTDDPKSFIDSMTRLVNQNLAVAEPPEWEELLFYSHPSYNKRVSQAILFKNEEQHKYKQQSG